MANEVKLPRLGQGMETGNIVKWLKSEGDAVKKGDPLYELDTDKVTQEVEAPADGVLLKIAVNEGEAAVGSVIAFIGEAGEEVTLPEPAAAPASDNGASTNGSSAPEAEAAPLADAAPAPAEASVAEAAAPSDGGRIKASPLARRIAREKGVELSQIRGTGPDGRIVAEDVERFEPGAAPAVAAVAAPARQIQPGEVEKVPLTNVRKTIVRRLTEAAAIPAFQLSATIDMTETLALRERLVSRLKEGEPKISPSDILTKAAAMALMRHPAVNALYGGDTLDRYGSANISSAVAVGEALYVPVIHGCEQRSLSEIAAARIDVVARARAGKLSQQDMEGGTFTISNLGPFGVTQFIAVLNPPQGAILAVGAIEEKPAVVDGAIVPRPLMTVTLTCDHRVVDGAPAAEFLATLKAFLEEPGLML
jgi:pyruvate dehydrogenase E2 component (dihydrolipoamide acetyltransferase)